MEHKNSPPTKPPVRSDVSFFSWWSRNTLVAKVLATIFVAIGLSGGLYYAADFGSDVEVRIDCPAVQGGYRCQVSLVSGAPPLISVCWELNSVCSNGVSASAKKCFKGHLEAGEPVSLLIANSDIKNYDRCDQVSAAAVENVTLGFSNGIITKGAL